MLRHSEGTRARAYANHATRCVDRDELEKAIDLYTSAITCYRCAVRAGESDRKRCVAAVLSQRGQAYVLLGDLRAASRDFRVGHRLCRILLRSDPDDRLERRMLHLHDQLIATEARHQAQTDERVAGRKTSANSQSSTARKTSNLKAPIWFHCSFVLLLLLVLATCMLWIRQTAALTGNPWSALPLLVGFLTVARMLRWCILPLFGLKRHASLSPDREPAFAFIVRIIGDYHDIRSRRAKANSAETNYDTTIGGDMKELRARKSGKHNNTDSARRQKQRVPKRAMSGNLNLPSKTKQLTPK